MKFRDLRADELELRAAKVADDGKWVSVLIYKDARCDMNVLDESNVLWQRRHYELKDNIYCEVGIWNDDIKQWIWKGDAGAESYTEAVKGEASDSFKRAGFNWGIGRKLYTAPSIMLDSKATKQRKRFKNGKEEIYYVLEYDVTLSEITYDDNCITGLEIKKGNTVLWQWGTCITTDNNASEGFDYKKQLDDERKKLLALVKEGAKIFKCEEQMLKHYDVSSIDDMQTAQLRHAKQYLDKKGNT